MKKAIAVLVTVVVTCLGVGGTAMAGEPTTTWFPYLGTAQGQIDAMAQVCHATQDDCGDPSGDMKFTLFKRKDGVWVKTASKVATHQDGFWSATFSAPRQGMCKMVAKYLGDGTYDPSKAVLKSSCNDSDWTR